MSLKRRTVIVTASLLMADTYSVTEYAHQVQVGEHIVVQSGCATELVVPCLMYYLIIELE